MTPKISFVTSRSSAPLVFAVPAFGDSWGIDRNQSTVHVSPDLVDRVDAARQQELSSMLDARERSLAVRSDATIVSTDPVRDDRFRLDPSSIPTPAATISWLVRSMAANRDRIRRRRPARVRPLPGNADDTGPPARALIRSRLPLGARSGPPEGGLDGRQAATAAGARSDVHPASLAGELGRALRRTPRRPRGSSCVRRSSP